MTGRELVDNGAGVVGGVVVDDEYLKVIARDLLLRDAGERLAQKIRAIVGGDRDGDFDRMWLARACHSETSIQRRAVGLDALMNGIGLSGTRFPARGN